MRTRLASVLLALSLGAVAACSPGGGTGGELDGTNWVLRSLANGGVLEIVPDGLYADAHFSGKRVDGFAGCNDYGALARPSGRTLLISQVHSTQKACEDIVMTFESTYLSVLHQSRFFGVLADTLTILGPGGQVIMVFDAAPKNPLLGRWVVDSFENAPGSQTIPLEGTELTAVFGITNVGGSSGCNTYDGVYGTNGTIVRISRLATTRQACADDVMTQEIGLPRRAPGVGHRRAPRTHARASRPERQRDRRDVEARRRAGRIHPAHPVARADRVTDAHADACGERIGATECHPCSDRHADPDPGSDGRTDADPGAHPRTARLDPADVDLRVDECERRSAGHPGLSGHVVHRVRPAGGGMPPLRSRADRRAHGR